MGIYRRIREWYKSFFEPIEPEIDDWLPAISDVSHVSLDDGKFIFAQAEKMLDDTIKVYDATTTKSLSVLTIINVILVAQVGFFFKDFSIAGTFDPKLATILLGCAYLMYNTFFLVKNVRPNTYKMMGSHPEKLFVNEFFDNSYFHNLT